MWLQEENWLVSRDLCICFPSLKDTPRLSSYEIQSLLQRWEEEWLVSRDQYPILPSPVIMKTFALLIRLVPLFLCDEWLREINHIWTYVIIVPGCRY